MRERLSTELKAAMKAGEKRKVETIRLINSAIKDRDIEARTSCSEVGTAEILAVMQKMVKSRQESLGIFTEAGRDDLAGREAEEITIIEGFLPVQMNHEQVAEAVEQIIASMGAAGIKDMGKVVSALKAEHAGRMDFGKASALVKARLTA